MEKLKNIKIAFVDIDGTLSNSNKEITSETSTAIKMAVENGLKVVLCSGRGNRYVYNFSKESNVSNYMICCNGAEVFDYLENTYLYCSRIEFDNIKKIWDYCYDNGICCILNSKCIRYCNSHLFVPDNDKIIINNIDEVKNKDIYQIVVGNNDFDSIYKMNKFIDTLGNLKIVNASLSYVNKIKNGNHYFLDITNNGVSKGNAIKELLNYLNLKKENAIGFGDHINDYELFNEVGFKIAMENASDALKEKANFITLSNDENGVAYFLNNFIDYDK